MKHQANGLKVATCDDAVVAAIDRLERDLLRYGRGVAEFLQDPAVDSGCALAEAMAAAIHLFAMTAQGRERAIPLIRAAQRHASGTSERERLFITGVAAWALGDTARSVATHLAIAERWPTDLISAKICQFHQLNAGDFGGMRRCTSALVLAQPENGFVHGMHAFALEQTGDALGAERSGRMAAAMNDDPWAHHAVAHVLDTAGRAAEGRDWMRAHASLWGDCSSFMYTHNWWHAALFDIALGDHGAALALYDARIWGVKRDCCQDQVNAVSLLIRLELLRVDVGDRWTDLAPHLERRIDDRENAFIDLHYAYGLAKAGNDAAVSRQIDGLKRLAMIGEDFRARAFREAAVTAAKGMVAHARGAYAFAACRLESVRGSAAGFGGSHTQRRLLDIVRIDSAQRSSCAAPVLLSVAR